MKKAFTFVELLVVIAVLSILAALLYPTFARAKYSAKIAKTKLQLSQIGKATIIYQIDNGGDGVYGTCYEMGLPPAPPPNYLPILNQLKPPHAPHPLSPEYGQLYYTMYRSPDASELYPWEQYAERARENSVLYIDPFNNSSDVPLSAISYNQYWVLGITVGNQLISKKRGGQFLDPRWYELP
jgi:prepilin-type N-terminal cleavage/methylation domain-containing protein